MFIGHFPCIKDSVYIDDGISGTTFKRDGFKSMMNDVQSGKVKTVIVKDMSRFGRDYIQVGLYTKTLFPQNNVRFIAINDNYDSVNGKTTKKSFKIKQRIDLPTAEWQIVPNTHEPIIDRDTFELVQKIRQGRRRNVRRNYQIPIYRDISFARTAEASSTMLNR